MVPVIEMLLFEDRCGCTHVRAGWTDAAGAERKMRVLVSTGEPTPEAMGAAMHLIRQFVKTEFDGHAAARLAVAAVEAVAAGRMSGARI